MNYGTSIFDATFVLHMPRQIAGDHMPQKPLLDATAQVSKPSPARAYATILFATGAPLSHLELRALVHPEPAPTQESAEIGAFGLAVLAGLVV